MNTQTLDMVCQNTLKIAKVRETRAMRELEMKKIEIDMKASIAEVNREREIQRRIQAIRQQVIHSIKLMVHPMLQFLLYFYFTVQQWSFIVRRIWKHNT